MSGPSNGPRPEGATPQSASSAPLSHSIVVPAARERLLEIFKREQLPREVGGTLEGSISGDLRLQQLLFYAMIDTWPFLSKALAEIKRKVRKAPWKVVPWAPRGEKADAKAEKLAKEVENSIWAMKPDPTRQIRGFEGTLDDLVMGYFLGHQLQQIEWDKKKGEWAPGGTKPISARYYGYPYEFHDEDRLMLDPSGGESGLSAYIDFPEHRFLIAVNGSHPGHPTLAAPLRALTGYWLAAVFGLKWFMQYSQLFGQPIRWANYVAGDTTAKAEIQNMMENIGAAAWGIFPTGTELHFESDSRGGTSLPQRELLKMADEQVSVFILGQNLTTTSGEKGARALGEVHMDVREEVVEGVCDFVGEILTHQLSASIVAVNYGDGRDDIPGIWAVYEQPRDEKAMAERDNALGITSGQTPVERQWFYERHGIPIPADGAPLFKEKPDPEPKIDPKTGKPIPPKEEKETEEEPPAERKEEPEKKKVEAADAGLSWRRFPANSGSLGVPRAEMPQIRSGDRASLVQFFRKRGIGASEETVPADTLKPTQLEFSPEKVRAALDYKGGNRSILVSEDDHVIDGHHQWQAHVMAEEDIRIIRLAAPIARCLMMAHRMPSTTVAASLREDLSDELDHPPRKKGTTLEKLSAAVMEGLTGVQSQWLGPVRPFFDKLLAAAMDETATDEDFQEVLQKAQRELPELFGVLDTQALREAMENAIGSAMLAGSVERYEK
ncbi:phage portal protein family protein [Luteolibacter luteus]|uniref:DUF935 family protein n=1 Tax=Luteolibacter luteus TaxID=2728835 RepID=A0A858RGJ3_9BACT|nr:DUF935 family protein [Luteolibacter luteus]QJE95967.1 DUF935 family protein [Luteolibacter luteus]